MSIHIRDEKSGDPPSSHISIKRHPRPVTISRDTNSLHGAPVMAALSGNEWSHKGHSQRFLCSCMLPHRVASSAHSLQVLRFILALAECINRGEHLAEWHHEMGTSCWVKRHRELFIRGINLLFSVCFVAWLCCVFKFTFLLVSSQGAQLFADSALHMPGRRQFGTAAMEA